MSSSTTNEGGENLTANTSSTPLSLPNVEGDDNAALSAVLSMKKCLNIQQNLHFIKKLTKLEEESPNLYKACHLVPGFSRTTNVYGGLTFAQSMLAAEQTTDDEFRPHAVHSFFLLTGTVKKPIRYQVQRVRDGRSFCTRLVQAIQDGKVIATSQISLHKDEPSAIEHQRSMPAVPAPETLMPYFDLVRKAIQSHETGERLIMDARLKQLNLHLLEEEMIFFEFRPIHPDRFLAIEPHQPDVELFWMRCIVPLPDADVFTDDAAVNVRRLHRFMLAFVTDTTMVSTANRPHFSHGFQSSMMFSLDHVVHFHDDNFRVDEWLLYENCSPFAKHGRALSEGRVWTRDGRLVASVQQESLSRSHNKQPSKL